MFNFLTNYWLQFFHQIWIQRLFTGGFTSFGKFNFVLNIGILIVQKIRKMLFNMIYLDIQKFISSKHSTSFLPSAVHVQTSKNLSCIPAMNLRFVPRISFLRIWIVQRMLLPKICLNTETLIYLWVKVSFFFILVFGESFNVTERFQLIKHWFFPLHQNTDYSETISIFLLKFAHLDIQNYSSP